MPKISKLGGPTHGDEPAAVLAVDEEAPEAAEPEAAAEPGGAEPEPAAAPRPAPAPKKATPSLSRAKAGG